MGSKTRVLALEVGEQKLTMSTTVSTQYQHSTGHRRSSVPDSTDGWTVGRTVRSGKPISRSARQRMITHDERDRLTRRRAGTVNQSVSELLNWEYRLTSLIPASGENHEYGDSASQQNGLIAVTCKNQPEICFVVTDDARSNF